MAKTTGKNSARYAIMLLFSYHIDKRGSPPVTHELRILHYQNSTRQSAIKKARAIGKASNREYENDRKQKVYFRFDRIVDVLELGLEADENEVWYDVIPVDENHLKSKPLQQWIKQKVSSKNERGRTDRKTYGRV